MSNVYSDTYAEVEVLGTILNDPVNNIVLARGNNLVTPDDFEDPQNKAVATALWTMDDHSNAINLSSLASWLNSQGTLQVVGGIGHLAELERYEGDLSQASERVVRASIRRKLRNLGAVIATLSAREDLTTDEVMYAIEEHLFAVRNRGQRNIVSFKDMLHNWRTELDAIRSGASLARLKTNISWLDDIIGPIKQNAFMIIGGRPGDGKSTLLRYIAYSIAVEPAPADKRGVYIADFEEGYDAWTSKLISLMTSIPSDKVISGVGLSDNDLSAVDRAIRILEYAPIVIESTSGVTVSQYRDRVRAAQRFVQREYNVPLGLHCADYLQRMRDNEGSNNQVTRNTNVSNSVRDICQPDNGQGRGLHVPGLMTAQLSRAPMIGGQMREYVKEDLRESGAIEQDATTIGFVIREWMMNSPTPAEINAFPENRNRPIDDGWVVEPVQIKIDKNRDGQTGKTQRVLWRKNINRYDPI